MRIGSVDIYKFFFSWVICLYHFYNAVSPNPYFPMGEIVVELFVLISGVFLYMGWERKKAAICGEDTFLHGIGISPYEYLKHRFLRFLPYSTTGFAFAFGVRGWLYAQGGESVTARRILTWLSDDIWEILMIKMNGMNNNSALLNVPAWTISAMLIAEFVVFALLVNHEKLFTTFVCPCVILIGYGYWRHIPKGNHEIWIGFTTFGLLRVFVLVCLSWYCWRLVLRLRAVRFTPVGIAFLTVSEVSLYLGALALLMNFDSRNFRWVITLMFLLAVAISVSGASFTKKIFPAGKVSRALGELSMGIYLTHYPIMRVYKHIWPQPYDMFSHKFSFIAVVFAAAVVFCVVSRCLATGGGCAVKGFKRAFIMEE